MSFSTLSAMFRRSSGLSRPKRRSRRKRTQLACVSVEACEPRLLLSATILTSPVQVPASQSLLAAGAPADDHVNTHGPDATDVSLELPGSMVTLTGVIDNIDDVDVFEFAVPAGMELRFDPLAPGPLRIPSLMATNSAFYFVSRQTGSDTKLAEGLWYISVSGDPSFQQGNYSLTFSVAAAPQDDHPNAWGPDATVVPPGPADTPLMFNGHLEHINDKDFFQFHLDNAAQLTLNWNSNDALNRGYVTLYDAFGRPAFNDSGPETITFSGAYPLTAGQWFLSVSGNPSFQSGSYSITGNLDDYPNVPTDVKQPNWQIPSPNTRINGRLETPADIDVLRFEVTQISDFYFPVPPGVQTLITDSSGNAVTLNDHTARLNNGSYFVSVKSLPDANAGAAYSLSGSLLPVYVAPVQITRGIGPSIDSTPNLTWLPVDGAISYDVYIALVGDSKPVFSRQGITQTSFEVPVELKNSNYTVWVKAKLSGNRQSLWGDGYPLRIGATPEWINSYARSGSISWQAVSGAQNYEIWLGTVNAKTGLRKQVMLASTAETTWEIPQSISAGNYGVWVRAVGVTANGTPHYSRWNAGEFFALEAAVPAPVINDWTLTTFVNLPFLPLDQLAGLELTETDLGEMTEVTDTDFSEFSSQFFVLSFNGTANALPKIRLPQQRLPGASFDGLMPGGIPPYIVGNGYDVRFIDVRTGTTLFQRAAMSAWDMSPNTFIITASDIELLAGKDYAVQARKSGWPAFNSLATRIPEFSLEPVVHRASGWSTAFPISLGPALGRPTSTATTNSGRPVLSWPITATRIAWPPIDFAGLIDVEDLNNVENITDIEDLTDIQDLTSVFDDFMNFTQYDPHYEIQIESSVTGQKVMENSIVSVNRFSVPDSLRPGGYSARVRATYDDGTIGDWSPAFTFKIASDPVLINRGTEPSVDATPTISWRPVVDASSYEVWIGPKGSRTPTYQVAGLTTAEHRVNTPLKPGTYDLFVRAHLRNGGITRWGTSTILQIGIPPVVTLKGRTISWQPVNGATRYEVWVNRVDAQGKLLAAKVINSDQIFEASTTVPASTIGKFRVWIRAIRNEAGETYYSNWSNSIDV